MRPSLDTRFRYRFRGHDTEVSWRRKCTPGDYGGYGITVTHPWTAVIEAQSDMEAFSTPDAAGVANYR